MPRPADQPFGGYPIFPEVCIFFRVFFRVPQLSLPKTRNHPRFLVVLKDPETTSRTVETGSL